METNTKPLRSFSCVRFQKSLTLPSSLASTAMSIVPHRVQKARGERHMFATSDDNAMMRQIQATHAPDGREFNVKPLLYIIEDIFQRATPSVPGFIQVV